MSALRIISEKMEISVVIPAKNEENNVEPLIGEIFSTLEGTVDYEIVYVDDGSDDLTSTMLNNLGSTGQHRLRPVRLKQSVGQSSSILASVNAARGELIVAMDADGQNDPADIPKLFEVVRQFPLVSDFCIAGYRKNRKDTRWKRFQSQIANAFRQKLLDDGSPDTCCGPKLIPKDTFLKPHFFDHNHRFIPALVRRINGSLVVLEVNHRDRQAGISKYNMLGLLGVGIIDMFGNMWLQRRAKVYERIDD